MNNILNSTKDSKLTFTDFKLVSPLQKAILNLGFEFCTPIQAQSLVHTLEGHDVTGRAQTGTGKTIAFLLTILNDLLSNPMKDRYVAEPRALIIAPTRELAIQIASDANMLTRFCNIHVVTLVGGEEYKKQLTELRKRVATIQKNKRSFIADIDKKRSDSRKKLLSVLNPIMKNYMKENNIKILVDKKNVLLGDSSLELTKQITDLLNKEIKSLNLK